MPIPHYNGRSGDAWPPTPDCDFSTTRKIFSNAPTPGTYIIWSSEGTLPTVEHSSRESALQEARRLAKQNPIKVFTVLYVSAACYLPQPVDVVVVKP